MDFCFRGVQWTVGLAGRNLLRIRELLNVSAASQIVILLFFATLVATSASAQTLPSPDCRLIASLPPMATLGGPGIAALGHTELGLAFGGYGEILPSPCIHAGGEDWLVRWRRAAGNRFDFGVDFLTTNQTDGSLGGTGKLAIRYGVTDGFRFEGGLGVADGGDGGNVNADVAAVVGTHNPNKSWNYYMSLRLGASRGCISCSNTDHAPGALVPLGVIGTTARISENTKFVMEAGMGGTFARQLPAASGYLHLSFGVLFDVGNRRK